MYLSHSLDQANELLKQGQGKIVQMDGTMDHFVQFYIETKTDEGTRTGNNHVYVITCAFTHHTNGFQSVDIC